MDILKKPLSVILGLLVVVVLVHFVFSPFYEDLLDTVQIWNIVNWLMAVGVIVTLIVTCIQKKGAGGEGGDTDTYICVSVAFYAAAILAVLFFWNWFDDLTVEDGQSQTRRNFWVVIDTLFIVLVGAVSAHLWKGTSRT